jgi:hypothetical protein
MSLAAVPASPVVHGVVATGSLTFSQHLVLWLHVAFVAFTIGPVTLAIMSTPRYIRKRDVRILRYLSRITFVFMLGSLGVLVAGMFLAQMLSDQGKWWVIVSATLFVVAVALLLLIVRDQRRAIRALTALTPATADGLGSDQADDRPAPEAAAHEPADMDTGSASGGEGQEQVATMERARIAMTGGLVSVIWLVILVLMVWNS